MIAANTIENRDQEDYVRRQRPVAEAVPAEDARPAHRETAQGAAGALSAGVARRAPNGSASGSRPALRPQPHVTPPSEPVELSATFYLRAIQSDYQQIGNAVFERFSTSGDKRMRALWYYRALFEVYQTDRFKTRDPRLRRLATGLGEILDWFDDRSVKGAGF